MTAALISVFNEALAVGGVRRSVSLPDERSREAEVCRLWYPTVRDTVMRTAPWPSNAAFRRLSLRATAGAAEWRDGDPQPGFRFAYHVPEDMLCPRYLTSFDIFTLTTDPQGNQSINTDWDKAILCYSVVNPNIQSWDVLLRFAVVHALAASIVIPLTGKTGFAQRLLEQANAKIAEARTAAQNVNQMQHETMPDWLIARGYAGGITQTRFLFPFGPLLAPGASGNAS